MKKSYKLGAHNIKLEIKPELKDKTICGQAIYESKVVQMRTTNANDGRPYDLPSALVVFFHEFFHMIDLMQGTDLFNDLDPEMGTLKEVALDSFSEGFVNFMLSNKILRDKWVKDWEHLLKNTVPLEKEDKDDS